VSIWPSPQGLILAHVARAKKVHIKKKSPTKKSTGPKTLQKTCGPGPTNELSSST